MKNTIKIATITQQLIKKLQLPENFEGTVTSVLLPLIELILDKKQNTPLLISINGAQGTGKSTLTYFIKNLIESIYNLPTETISLDDFYLTKKQRQQLGKNTHPLLITRGAPGTHDIELMEQTLSTLREKKTCTIPRFDKSIDDRYESCSWTKCNNPREKPIEIILFEGWCNHSPYQTAKQLVKPINALEESEDEDGSWRTYVNEQLKIYHNKIFKLADVCIMLKAPAFNKVYEWRSLQEEKMRKSSSHSTIMSTNELTRFIQHFERITRNTLEHLPKTADIILPVLNDHSIERIIKNPSF